MHPCNYGDYFTCFLIKSVCKESKNLCPSAAQTKEQIYSVSCKGGIKGVDGHTDIPKL